MIPALLGLGWRRYCSSTSCCRTNSERETPRSRAARVSSRSASGSSAIVEPRRAARCAAPSPPPLRHAMASSLWRHGQVSQENRSASSSFAKQSTGPRAVAVWERGERFPTVVDDEIIAGLIVEAAEEGAEVHFGFLVTRTQGDDEAGNGFP